MAAARWRQNRAGSLSPASSDSQATGDAPRPAQSASRAVLPKPAGALTSVSSLAVAWVSRSSSRPRDTNPGRVLGWCSLVASSASDAPASASVWSGASLSRGCSTAVAIAAHAPGSRTASTVSRHGAVMAYLDAEGSRATALAQQSGQHKQVIGTLVDELVELGYVRREPDPDDRRAKLIVPTPLGLDEMAKADAILAAIEQRHGQALGEAAYDRFKRAFRQVAHLQRAWRDGERASRDGRHRG
jgi:DNA-binding MarR family transcriptional regulator